MMIASKSNEFLCRNSAFSPYRLMNNELGFGKAIGSEDAIASSFYCGMKPIASWVSEQDNILPTGGVFNLEFSPEGTMLVAACEKKSIQIFDPLTYKRIHTVSGAHSDCVNCVKFLDGRMFATCSDDTTIAIWDVRNLKKKIRSLLGHSNWVKNIEFSVKNKLLVTSGLDGSIYTWDINSYTECNLVYQRVFHAAGLMRCRLSPDAQQMVMCTTGGLLVIIHDLNLSTLAKDLHGFKPNLYRLMQMSGQRIPIVAMYDHLFDNARAENRVEFISDFPEGNEAEVVSALQIHPQGWTALSRNISHNDRSEWTCIHDIQADECSSSKSVRDGSPARATSPPRARPAPRRARRMRLARPYTARTRNTEESTAESPAQEPSAASSRDNSTSRISTTPPGVGGVGAGGGSMQNDVWEASITIRQHRMVMEMARRGQVGRNFNMQRIMGVNTGIPPPPPAQPAPRIQRRRHADGSSALGGSSPPASTSTPASARDGGGGGSGKVKHFIRQNKDRLLYYIEETNEGKGFIKELCYSADGRIVCSPFGRGMRLLALNQTCSELSHCVDQQSPPVQMAEVGQSLGIHQDLVVSSKFSPRHHLLVTGCLEGKIVWYSPFSGETLY